MFFPFFLFTCSIRVVFGTHLCNRKEERRNHQDRASRRSHGLNQRGYHLLPREMQQRVFSQNRCHIHLFRDS